MAPVGKKTLHRYRTLGTQRAYEGQYVNLRLDRVRFPDGVVRVREVVEHPGSVAVVALDGGHNVYLVRQYRPPAGKEVLEIPAGLVDDGESPERSAHRELKEEVGGDSDRLIHLASFYMTPGYSDERLHLYLALELRETGSEPEDDEFLEIEKMPLGEALGMIETGEIEDIKTIAGLVMAARHLEAGR